MTLIQNDISVVTTNLKISKLIRLQMFMMPYHHGFIAEFQINMMFQPVFEHFASTSDFNCHNSDKTVKTYQFL